MQVWIALFRGINVGGNNVVPMADLRTALVDAGFKDVQSYIQSGNVVFQAEGERNALREKIAKTVEAKFGFEPKLMLFSCGDIEAALAENPFPSSEVDPKSLHLMFMDDAPSDPDLKGIENLKSESESFQLLGAVFYLHAPDGVGRSKLFARAERLLGTPATGRNWRSVTKILALAKAL